MCESRRNIVRPDMIRHKLELDLYLAAVNRALATESLVAFHPKVPFFVVNWAQIVHPNEDFDLACAADAVATANRNSAFFDRVDDFVAVGDINFLVIYI